jgi:predicted nucleic acid-binding protein
LELLGIRKIGTLGILLKAKEVGLVAAVKPDMDKLRARGFRLSKRVYETVLSVAGES